MWDSFFGMSYAEKKCILPRLDMKTDAFMADSPLIKSFAKDGPCWKTAVARPKRRMSARVKKWVVGMRMGPSSPLHPSSTFLRRKRFA